MEQPGVTVLVTVKVLGAAKTRLAPALDDPQRSALVLTMLTDTLAVAVRSPRVHRAVVVSADPAVLAVARRCGAEGEDDPTGTLNDALAHAAAGLDPARAVLVLQGDLPALRTAELTGALDAAGPGRAAVADAAGTGTTALLAPAGTILDPCFGPGSAAAHARSGAALLTGAWPGLRTDVDTLTDLALALRLGVGPATAALLDSWGTPATVAEHGADQVLLRTDDGRLLTAPVAAATLGGWRQLRPGQRVRVHTGSDGVVHLLTLAATLPPG